jgi:Ca-activated chloride channel homolog
MIRIEHPEYFLLLTALIVIAVIYVLFFNWRKKALRQLGEQHLLKSVMTDYSRVKSVIKFVVGVLAFILIVLGLMNLQVGSATKKVQHSGIDIALVMDVSNSMLATDAAPNRLDAARKTAQQLADQFPESRIAIVSFAASSSTILPLTPDHAAAQMVLSNLSTQYALIQGTDLGGALIEAIHALPSNQNRYRAIVVFSDGEDHEHKVNEAIDQINQEGITVCTAGVGTEQGSEIPLDSSLTDVKRDSKGNVVITKMNTALLKQVAQKTSGAFFPGDQDNSSAAKEIATRLNAIEKNTFDEKIFVQYESRFQYFLLSALLLLILETFFGNRRKPRVN